MPTIIVKDAAGANVAVELPNSPGRLAAANSKPIVLSTEDKTALDAITTAVNNLAGTEYETVAAAATDQVLGATGAAGDLLAGLLVIPTSTSPGAISIKDGSGGTAIPVFAGGASSITTLHPFFIPLNIRCISAGWRVTTGANLSVIGVGNFT